MPYGLNVAARVPDEKDFGGARSIRCTSKTCSCRSNPALRDPLPGQPTKASRRRDDG